MNAPFALTRETISTIDLRQPDEAARIEGFVADQRGSLFHRPAWLRAVEQGTGQKALGLVAEKGEAITGWLPLTLVHSPIFGRALVSSGFAVGGGILAESQDTAAALASQAQTFAQSYSCANVELRGGFAPQGWDIQDESHCGFVTELAEDDEAQLLAIPRKQRAEVRKGLGEDLTVEIGKSTADRAAHYGVYAESVRNLGTPVFPKALFDAALDLLDGDILTVRQQGEPVASVLSFYHDGAVLPYWGGGTFAARKLRANDRMYYELMLQARRRGCTHFDFGRSKTNSGAYHFKRNWGFEPEPLSYASWTAPGAKPRDINPASGGHSRSIELWKRLPLSLANLIGPHIARGLG
jgi:FemAB-related protein (PEP-CTERM system-associated)